LQHTQLSSKSFTTCHEQMVHYGYAKSFNHSRRSSKLTAHMRRSIIGIITLLTMYLLLLPRYSDKIFRNGQLYQL